MTGNKPFAAAILAAAVVLAGCAHQVPASPDVKAIPTPANKTPLNVGLYISDAFQGYQHSEAKWGDTWNFNNLGQASAGQFREAFDKNFASVVRLDKKPSRAEADANKLDLMIAPEIESYSFDIPFTKFQVYPATVSYKVDVYEGDALSFSKVVRGVGDTAGSPGFDFAENPAKSASRAIEEGVNEVVKEILSSDRVQELIRAKSEQVAEKAREF